MKAVETKLTDFMQKADTKFIIPVYQRNYDWKKEHCKQLIDDILHAGSTDITSHFIGSLVYVHDDLYMSDSIKRLTIIDGQQRLTTITLIFIVVYRLSCEIDDKNLQNKIMEQYLINKFFDEDEKLKLKPTDNNAKALNFLLRNDPNEEYKEYSNIIENFEYLRTRISEENYKNVLLGLNKILFVEISLDRHYDSPQRIFESLNSTGKELSPSDLIRNYILMALEPKQQNYIYSDYWIKIEENAKDNITHMSMVSDFIRHFLTFELTEIPNKKQVYSVFRETYQFKDFNELKKLLSRLKKYSKHYDKLINPKNEIDMDIRRHLIYIKKLEINVAYPFLIPVYDDLSEGIIDKNCFINILEFVQSFIWRRFVLSLPTNALNKIFKDLYWKIDKENYLFSLQKYILNRPGTSRFPKDFEIIEALKVKDMYNIQSKNRTYFFEKLENHDNKEYVLVDKNPHITIEHIFPRNPDASWKKVLSTNEFRLMNDLKHTAANLTLSGNNGKLSNKSFLEKRDLPNYGYRESRLWLNKQLADLDEWNQEKLDERFQLLKNRFFDIWKYPEIEVENGTLEDIVNIFDAENPKHRKLDFFIFFDKKYEIKEISKLYAEVFRTLFDKYPHQFFTTDLGEKITLTKNPNFEKIRQTIKINETYYIEGNLDNNSKFDKIKYALQLFDLEDELMIKYAEKD
jgi:uncharacterized protein with ParB-like and HNH nuclease domain